MNFLSIEDLGPIFRPPRFFLKRFGNKECKIKKFERRRGNDSMKSKSNAGFIFRTVKQSFMLKKIELAGEEEGDEIL